MKVPSNAVTSAPVKNIGRVPYKVKSSCNFLIFTDIDFLKKTCLVWVRIVNNFSEVKFSLRSLNI